MKSSRLCYACDLKDDPILIAEYKKYHQKIWPEIQASILEAGILQMEIYLYDNRLFMIMEVDESYSPERKKAIDDANPKVQQWEKLMWNYQQAMPSAKVGEKWVMMDKIFKL